MPKIALICFISAVTLFSGRAGATTIISTFDTDLDGWTTNPQGTLVFVATGGTPAGFLEETDASSGNMHVSAPGKFLGDLTWANNFSVDIRAYVNPTTIRAAFGTLTFLNSAGASSISLDLGNPSTAWTQYGSALNPAAFGVSAATYSAVMSNVTGLTLILEADKDSDVEKVGMDNFRISDDLAAASDVSTPEPVYFSLIGAALTLGAVVRRKTSV